MRKPFAFSVADGDFRKSSWSKNNPKTCVAIAKKRRGVAVRDTKDPGKTTLFFTNAEWKAFTKAVNAGEF